MNSATLLLSRDDVERLLTPDACIAAVEDAFLQLADGKAPSPGILGMHAAHGGFHVKAGFLQQDRLYFAAKLNANFPQNAARHGLPTIQGAVILSDAGNGALLAGRRPGRESDDEISVFDSTGTGIQDVAAAIAVYRRALAAGAGTRFTFS